jgi:hypothetical protein
MAKKLIHKYTFDPANDRVTIKYIYKPERLLLISNITRGVLIYAFNEETLKFNTITYDYTNEEMTITLAYDCSAMSSTDKLQIFVEEDSMNFEPSETFVDPVSKFRISQPENLIDTDFEYGLQSTKWETLELVKNIPTFFSRSGDSELIVNEISTINGSDIVTVVLGQDHGFLSGTPVIVLGTRNISCDGTFIVTTIIDSTSFQYKAKSVQNFTGSVLSDYTQVFPGQVYQGTEFDLTGIEAITTDAQSASLLTVTTEYPTGFINGTSFYLSNSVGQINALTDASLAVADNYLSVVKNVTNNVATGESGFSLGATQIYNFVGTETVYFTNSQVTINATTGIESITFSFNHGIPDNTHWMYVPGELNGVIGGLTAYTGYYVRTISANAIYLTTTLGGTTRVNLTAGGTNGGVHRSAFIRAYRALSAVTATDQVTFAEAHGFTSNENQALLFFNGAMTNMNVSASLHTPSTVYYPKTVSSATATSFTATPGGAQVDLTTTTANALVIKVIPAVDANSIYFQSHGLSNNNVILFTTVSGTAPTGLTSGIYYKAEIVNSDRIRFKDNETGAVINLTVAGTAVSQYRIETRTPILTNDSVVSPNHGLRDNNPVIYDAQGNTPIPGLVDNTLYYAFGTTTNNFKLASVSGGWKTDARSITQSTGVSVSTNVITTLVNHGFTTGDAVQYLSVTPVGGLTNGAFYWVRSVSANTCTLHWTKDGANANNETVDLTSPIAGNGTLRTAHLVDITGTSTGTHRFKATSNSASDGVYTINQILNDNTFTLSSNNQVPLREFVVVPQVNLDLGRSAIYFQNHSMTNLTRVTYATTGTAIGGLTDDTDYYVIRISRDWFKLALTEADAANGTAITLTSLGTGTHLLSTPAISGEVQGPGTISLSNGTDKVVGVTTNFTAIFSPGDNFVTYQPTVTATKTITSINTTTDELTASVAHSLTTADPVIMSATTAPGGTTNTYIYYVRVISATVVTLHPTPANATNNTNRVDITSAGTTVTLQHISSIGSTTTFLIKYVNSTTELILRELAAEEFTSVSYALGTALLIRADGFALHRPYDGGVELIPSTNPDSQMIRQTRKYFRYQSGKGIQVSFAVNFSPSTVVESFSVSVSTGLTTGIVTVRYPHRLSQGVEITISGAINDGGANNYWNGVFTVASILDPYRFTVTLAGEPSAQAAAGIIEYHVNSWSNSLLKCGLFDDQNGLYFEYDGSELSCVRRSSVLQVSGTSTFTFKSGTVNGTNTRFSSQLSVGDRIVAKGQTYLVTKIASDTLMYIIPSYRGITNSNVIITKTIDTKVPQSQWNIDPCVGTGPTGFYLDINKIQMAYMDYSWYGAGKVRFGFKNQNGQVVYVHEFIHNNKFTEAYMRSGNLPARYEIENTGSPTYVPALAHWGTSVIMDGRFDDDRAYVFTASSLSLSITGSANLTVSARVESTLFYQVFVNNQWRSAGHALTVATPSPTFNNIPTNSVITGAGLQANTRTRLPNDNQINPRQPYLPSVNSRTQDGLNQAARSLLLLDKAPTTVAGAASNYTVTLSGAATPVVYEQPLISIRLSPSVDTGTPGALGQREIINRMQLILSTVGVLSTHAAEITLRLNGQLNNNSWQRVTNPSLSQLIYHSTSDTIIGGTVVYSFRASGGTGTTARAPVITTADLDEIATLGNSILGGDNIFPDGPDVLTVVAKLVEDPSTVTTTNPFTITSRISWSESQA